MEYERALFRVYDRTLDSLRSDQPVCDRLCGGQIKPITLCRLLEFFLLASAVILFLFLLIAHNGFVGDAAPGCLATELSLLRQALAVPEASNGTSSVGGPLLGKRDVLQLRLSDTASAFAVAVPGKGVVSSNYSASLGGDANDMSAYSAEYRFSRTPALLYLPDGFLTSHNVALINVTLSKACLTQGDAALQNMAILFEWDTPVMNQLLALGAAGMVENTKTQESWGWGTSILPPEGGRSLAAAAGFKASVLLQALAAFFFTATVTAMMVRMLISSGVIIMFPLFFCLRRLGLAALDMNILTLSYPWLGVPVEILRRQRKPVAPLIVAHIVRVIVLYSMYEASQIAWGLWMYDKPFPVGMQLEVYALIMIWEYFAMIYLRSAAGIYYLPKFALVYFLGFHFYFYAYPYAYFDVALLVAYLLTMHSLVYGVTHFEVPAASRLEVSFEQPRAFYTELPWPSWHAALPPSWTLFLPLNARHRNIYEEQPPAPGGGGGGPGAPGAAPPPPQAAAGGGAAPGGGSGAHPEGREEDVELQRPRRRSRSNARGRSTTADPDSRRLLDESDEDDEEDDDPSGTFGGRAADIEMGPLLRHAR
mmetsp:Transcript_19258/g.56018  ORF Transcript_19258/g.56018 Transcript_19258/m.56018 type:complete len:593 (-) Transcript_19258:17-1795(-)